MFVARLFILEKLFADPEWSSKLEAAKTEDEIIKVLKDFCRARGYKMKDIELKNGERLC